MAGFVEVWNQAKRMCKEFNDCDNCALCELMDDAHTVCPFYDNLDTAKIEAVVMDWATKNPGCIAEAPGVKAIERSENK